jgi:hypothetical protein
MKIETLFLYKVYRHSKKLFYLFLLFTVVTIFCNLAGFEMTPFYVWGMYSAKEKEVAEYPVYKITADGKLIDYSSGYFPANRFFLTSPLDYYADVSGIGSDPLQNFLRQKLKNNYFIIAPFEDRILNCANKIDEFPKWYKMYLQKTTGKKINNIKVDVLNVHYTNNNSIVVDSTYNLINEE